jgi:hypothetical protein
VTFQPVVEHLLEELEEIGQVIDRIKEGLQKLEQTHDSLYADSIALNIHGFYNGLERVFEQIANEIDVNLPHGGQWHHELLLQMGKEIQGVRPAVLSEQILNELDEYRSFRHVVRHIYSFKFNRTIIKPLATGVEALFEQISKELRAFISFLESSESADL